MCSKCSSWALTQAERRRRHWLSAATTIERSSCLRLTNSLAFSSARRYYYATLQALLEMQLQCSCVLSGLRNKSSKFYKITPVLTKVMLNLSGFVFLWTQCRFCKMSSVYSQLTRVTDHGLHIISRCPRTDGRINNLNSRAFPAYRSLKTAAACDKITWITLGFCLMSANDRLSRS